MSAPIGFVLLTHTQPAQIARLIDRLTRIFEFPPIVVHHDFSQSPLDTAPLPRNVSFVVPALKTAWGKFSAVQGSDRGVPPYVSGACAGLDYPA